MLEIKDINEVTEEGFEENEETRVLCSKANVEFSCNKVIVPKHVI